MNIKVGKFEANVPAWAFVLAALLADNMYANHCKNKSFKRAVEACMYREDDSDDEEEES